VHRWSLLGPYVKREIGLQPRIFECSYEDFFPDRIKWIESSEKAFVVMKLQL
jgi:hypothetical protein